MTMGTLWLEGEEGKYKVVVRRDGCRTSSDGGFNTLVVKSCVHASVLEHCYTVCTLFSSFADTITNILSDIRYVTPSCIVCVCIY